MHLPAFLMHPPTGQAIKSEVQMSWHSNFYILLWRIFAALAALVELETGYHYRVACRMVGYHGQNKKDLAR